MKIKKSIKLIGTTMLLSSLVVGGNLITSCSKGASWKNYVDLAKYLDKQKALNIGDGSVFISTTGDVLTFMMSNITVEAIINGIAWQYFISLNGNTNVIETFQWKIENKNAFSIKYIANGEQNGYILQCVKTENRLDVYWKQYEDEHWNEKQIINGSFANVALVGTSIDSIKCDFVGSGEDFFFYLRPQDFNATFARD